ncbi:MAG: N-acetyltransferase [Bdellovibrionota bacterium]
MSIEIRTEEPMDYAKSNEVVYNAFKGATHSDGDEHNLVQRLRASSTFVPKLSLVAVLKNEIVGHIIFSKIIIVKKNNTPLESLALAPVSVHPNYQKKKIGGALINRGHMIAKELGFKSVILLGHPDYYPRFGYSRASKWGIQAPFDVPDEVFMAIELVSGALDGASGVVQYPSAFRIT